MARRDSSESSDDDRERRRRYSDRKKETRSVGRRDRGDESDNSSDSDQKQHRHERRNERGNGNSNRPDEERDVSDRREGERDKDKRDLRQDVREESKNDGEEEEGKDGKRVKRDRRDRERERGRERGRQDENGEDGFLRKEDRHRCRDLGEDNEREERRKSDRGRDRRRNARDRRRNDDDDDDEDDQKYRDRREIKKDEDGDTKYRRDKEKDRRREESRNKDDSKAVGDSKVKSTRQEGNVNGGDAALTLGRSGGVYIPPFKLARMMKDVEDKSSAEYQRLTWDALRKSINGLVNKVNATNIKNIIPELFAENLIRGRGLFCRSCMKSQMASPGFTDVFAALVAVVNTKFTAVGELLLKRIVLQLKRAYKRNDKPQLLAAVKFIAHLVNQQVAHEIIALELLTILLENPTDDSVEVAVGFVKECGSILQDLSPKGLHGIFERFRGILHEGEIDKRVQFLIEGLFAIRKAKFQGYPAVRPELDLVDIEDQLTHEISLQDEIDPEITLDIFKPDPNFLDNEKRYEDMKKDLLGETSEDEEGSDAGSGDEDDSEEEEEEEDEEQMKIKDETETNLVNLRRTIYLTIMSSVDFEEAGHKLLKIKLEPGQEELSEHLGIRLLNERLTDPTMQDSFESIFPRDNPKNTRFAINFFTSIGLGGITENLREYLKNMPRLIMQQQKQVSESEPDSEADNESESSDSSDSDTSSSQSESEDSSSSDESNRDKRHSKRRRRH
ncbi:MI domain-containing protein [Citrus sinensis]|uniref:MI domain-containing protein n=1 Tax=Citrus sinensis TaxID=2711 RepID=A0ACB8IIC9_CITSI|nr:MI domain-containing protein [Citrus sinensis]